MFQIFDPVSRNRADVIGGELVHQSIDVNNKLHAGGEAEMGGNDLMVNLGGWTDRQFRTASGRVVDDVDHQSI